MEILLDVLDELGGRFIMAEGAAPEEIRKMLQARVGKGSSNGLLAAWAPQRAILSHPVGSVLGLHAKYSCHEVYGHVHESRRE